MSITLEQASKALKMTEDEVIELVLAGKLKGERKGAGLLIDEPGVRALIPGRPGAGPVSDGEAGGGPRADASIGAILDRLAALEKEISEKLALLDENRRLFDQIRRKERELALKETEIEKLKRDLVYQKKLLEKEIEDRARVLDEKRAGMDREISERISRERDESERRLDLEKGIWSERLAGEQEKFAAKIAEMHSKEGFWARMLRLLTWS